MNEPILGGDETGNIFQFTYWARPDSGADKWRALFTGGHLSVWERIKWGKDVSRERGNASSLGEFCSHFLLSWEDLPEEKVGAASPLPAKSKETSTNLPLSDNLLFHWDKMYLGVALSSLRMSKKATTQFTWDFSWLWSRECVFKSWLHHISNIWLWASYQISLSDNFFFIH